MTALSENRLKATLLGTGSSGGVPRIGGDWGACDPAEPRNRRSRCSILVESRRNSATDSTAVLVDTSPDLREQLLRADVKRLDAVLITHDHADQTHGLDDLRALALRMRRRMPIHMDEPTSVSLTQKFAYCFEGAGGYPSILDQQPLIEPFSPFAVSGPGGAISVLPVIQRHGRIDSLGFRFGPLAYCNDTNHLPERSLAALEGVEILIVDALRYTPHPTHAHVEQALAWIERIKPERAILTNLHVDLDYRTLKGELPRNVEPAYDGMVVEASYECASL